MKWDTFIGRKGGMNNTLAPLKNSTNTYGTSSASSSSGQTDLNRPAKLDSTPQGKRHEKPKIEDVHPLLTPDQHRHAVKNEDTKKNDLLKGKPIIFVSGGPGMKRNHFKTNEYFHYFRQW